MYAPWFGPLPFYKDVFIKCCGQAPLIRWVVHSDQPAPTGLPPNVKWHTLPSPGGHIARVFGALTPVRVWGHKLCDLKPFWHKIFHDPGLDDTEFHGWCDWDVVHNLSGLPFQFERAKFTIGSMSAPLFIQRHGCELTLWPLRVGEFLKSGSTAWDEVVYLPAVSATFIQAGMTPGVDLSSKAEFAVHLYLEKQSSHLYERAVNRYCGFSLPNLAG